MPGVIGYMSWFKPSQFSENKPTGTVRSSALVAFKCMCQKETMLALLFNKIGSNAEFNCLTI